MSAPVTVTEAQYQLAHKIRQSSTQESAAQLIADSEARAVRDALWATTCTHHNDKQRAECPVCLVATLRGERDQLLVRCDELTESANLSDAAFQEQYSRAQRAESELAVEREKVRTLHKALGNVKDSICRNVPDGYSQPCVDESADECDRIIDAAMKEGA